MGTINTIFQAQLEVARCAAELLINDIPVSRIVASPRRIPIENVAIEHLIIPGENVLELVVEPGVRPSQARTAGPASPSTRMRACGRIIRFRDGVPGLPEHGQMIVEVAFRGDPSGRAEASPRVRSATVNLGVGCGRWGWQDAPRLVLDDSLRQEARDTLNELELAIRTLDEDRVWELTALQIADVLRAYPALSRAHLREDLRSRLEHLRAVSDPVVERRRSEEDFRLVANGRLLQLVNRDWSTTCKLRAPGTDQAVPYAILLGRMDGRLRILR